MNSNVALVFLFLLVDSNLALEMNKSHSSNETKASEGSKSQEESPFWAPTEATAASSGKFAELRPNVD